MSDTLTPFDATPSPSPELQRARWRILCAHVEWLAQYYQGETMPPLDPRPDDRRACLLFDACDPEFRDLLTTIMSGELDALAREGAQ